jgi:hypothetical protein
MGAQGSSCGGECDAVPDEETLNLMRRSQSAATRSAAEGCGAALYSVSGCMMPFQAEAAAAAQPQPDLFLATAQPQPDLFLQKQK